MIGVNVKGVKCDNPNCDYTDSLVESKSSGILNYVKHYMDTPCPKCGENLLTKSDAKKATFIVFGVNCIGFAIQIFIIYLVVKGFISLFN